MAEFLIPTTFPAVTITTIGSSFQYTTGVVVLVNGTANRTLVLDPVNGQTIVLPAISSALPPEQTSTTAIQSSSTTSPTSVAGTDGASSTLSTTEQLSNSATAVSSTVGSGNATSTNIPALAPAKAGGVSPGAVAGIAIGVVILGALIGAVAAGLWLRKKQRRSYPPVPPPSSEKPTIAPAFIDYNKLLPQALDHVTVKEEVSRFFDNIDDHTENFYNKASFNDAVATRQGSFSASLLATLDQQADSNFEALLENPRSRKSAIACLIATQILESINPYDLASNSILPAVILSFYRCLPELDLKEQAQALSFSRWRTSTTYLLSLGQHDNSNQLYERQKVGSLVQNIDISVAPFASVESAESRRRDIEALCKQGQHLGLTMLSQPTLYELVWGLPRDQKTRGTERSLALAVYPGLRIAIDEDGKLTSSSKPLLRPRVKVFQ